MTHKPASLSLDLDNLWSYMKVHGDRSWESLPSYPDLVVPRFLSVLEAFSLRITVFVVGQDAALERNHGALRSIADAGHEIGNHSFHHEPWLHLYSAGQVESEIERAEAAIETATKRRPRGFRGPGYSLSEVVLNALRRLDYSYDCSTFPTLIGPLARAYYFMNSRLSDEQRSRRGALFGGLRDGLRPLAPYRWNLSEGLLVEIPITTLPVLKVPMHFSYLHWLAGFSEMLASTYFSAALRACDTAGVRPSLLMHPLDFLGHDDVSELRSFRHEPVWWGKTGSDATLSGLAFFAIYSRSRSANSLRALLAIRFHCARRSSGNWPPTRHEVRRWRPRTSDERTKSVNMVVTISLYRLIISVAASFGIVLVLRLTAPSNHAFAVFLVYNGLAGVGISARNDGEFFRLLREPMIERCGMDDLIVMAQNCTKYRFQRYRGTSSILQAGMVGIEAARRAVAATFAEGGKVLVVDALAWAPRGLLDLNPTLAPALAAFVRDYSDAAERRSTQGTGWFYEIQPESKEQ